MLSTLRYVFKYRQQQVDRWMFYISMACAFIVIFHIGYNRDTALESTFDRVISILFYVLLSLSACRTLFTLWAIRRVEPSVYGGFVLLGYFILIAFARMVDDGLQNFSFLLQSQWMYLGIFAVFLTEFSKSSLFFDNFYFNPTILFVISFLVLIMAGTLLLMLPKTVIGRPLDFVDALFMATSAVCITGLSVVDVATRFSGFGQTILLVLMQVGGLGIMTFTGFFGYFFSGGFSYKNQLMYSEILGQNKIGSVVSTLLKIIGLTLLFEVIGVMLIYWSVEEILFSSVEERLFFSVFHAVSAFCNAGFTTIPGGLEHVGFRFAYPFHLVIAWLFLLGGIGFGVVLNLYQLAKNAVINIVQSFFQGKVVRHQAWVMSFNTRIVLWSTLILVIASTLLTFALEYRNSLQMHDSLTGKWITAFFIGNTPRSAGFSTMDISNLSLATIMLLMMMMWIGSSPGSTGGGIKTTTFAVALLNILSLAKGKENLELFRRRIANDAVNKAFAIIVLSLLAIGITTFSISVTDGSQPLHAILFESFSAYTTSGLSMGITSLLSDEGKTILVLSMFVGRVGLLTLLVAMIKNTKKKSYMYPQENVLY